MDRGLSIEERAILDSDFRDDSDIYTTKGSDIVWVGPPKYNSKTGKIEQEVMTKDQYDQYCQKVFSVKS